MDFFLLQGVSMKGITSDHSFGKRLPGFYEVTETRTLRTRRGGSETMFVLQPFRVKESSKDKPKH